MKKLSIITVAYNSSATIRDTIISVENQEYRNNIQHIVIDGGSNDGTLEIVREFKNVELYTEKDDGVFDAMNKGLLKVRFEFVLWLNSDDYLIDSKALNHFFKNSNSQLDLYIGSINIVDIKNFRVLRKIIANKPNKLELFCGWIPPHPAYIIRTKIANKINGYDCRYKISADYGFMIKGLLLSKEIVYNEAIITLMRSGGLTNSGLPSKFKILKDIWPQMINLGFYNPVYPLTRILLKLIKK